MDYLQRQELMFTSEEMKQISDLTVLIAGVGGLGTHQALELQRTGVEKMYLLDSDKVETSNLNRQILYGKQDIGRSKAIRAKEVLDNFELGTEIEVITDRIDAQTVIPSDVDLVFDALDNFESRYLLEDAVIEANLPLIHGGIHSWYGQITTIIPHKTATLRELFEEKDDTQGEIPVFSSAVSVVASLQVIEGIKVILGRDDILTNKLLMIDLNDYSLVKIEI